MSNTRPPLNFAAVILAAGRSSRMGRPKLLLPWGESSVLGHLIEQWTKLGARQIAVVCAAGAREIEAELDRVGVPEENRIINPNPNRGMFSSIQCAAVWQGWNRDLTHWVVTLGDQPHLQGETLRGLIEFGAVNPGRICQPMRGGRARHPVLLPRAEFESLRTTHANNLKQFLQEHAGLLAGVESDDAGLDLDMDTPDDYERLKRRTLGG